MFHRLSFVLLLSVQYHLFNAKLRRHELAVLEMYETSSNQTQLSNIWMFSMCARLTPPLLSFHFQPCTHTHTHTHTRTHTHTHTHTHTRTHTRTHAHMHTHTHTCAHARTHAHTHAHTRTHTHAHPCTHMHTHTHTHTHTCAHARTHAHSSVWSSLVPPPSPEVTGQAYTFPTSLSTLTTTHTLRGITHKSILCKSFALATKNLKSCML